MSSTRNASISTPLIFDNRVTQNFRMNEVSRHNSPHSSNIDATYPFRMPFFHCSNNYSTCPCSTSLCSTCHKTPVKHGLEKQWPNNEDRLQQELWVHFVSQPRCWASCRTHNTATIVRSLTSSTFPHTHFQVGSWDTLHKFCKHIFYVRKLLANITLPKKK